MATIVTMETTGRAREGRQGFEKYATRRGMEGDDIGFKPIYLVYDMIR
jgi:hypothetical protein